MRIDEKLTDYAVEQVVLLVKTPSLAGHTDEAIGYVEQELTRMGVKHRRTGRGALLVTLEGREPGPHRALTAHVDTLGAMVKELGKDGTLLFTSVGGYALATVEGEYVTVETGTGKRLRGTILFDEPSAHVSKKVVDTKREFENMRIRLDAEVKDEKGLARLGIAVGDYVHFDPRCEVTDTGFIKTRHLDDKAGVACLLGALKAMVDSGLQPRLTTHFLFSTSEEVGFGTASPAAASGRSQTARLNLWHRCRPSTRPTPAPCRPRPCPRQPARVPLPECRPRRRTQPLPMC